MPITIATIAVSFHTRLAQRWTVHAASLRRQLQGKVTILPIQYLDVPHNSAWVDVQAADIVVALIGEDLLVTLDDLTDSQSGNNLVRDELRRKRRNKEFRLMGNHSPHRRNKKNPGSPSPNC